MLELDKLTESQLMAAKARRQRGLNNLYQAIDYMATSDDPGVHEDIADAERRVNVYIESIEQINAELAKR